MKALVGLPGTCLRKTSLCALLAAAAASAGGQPASAQNLFRFAEADLALGERLRAAHQCEACHVRKVGGNGHAIYRPAGRINSPKALLAMVELCSVELKLQLFPEEIEALAAVLQRDHYRFAARAPGAAAADANRP